MLRVLKAAEVISGGTSLKGYLEDVNFMDLTLALGEPTFNDPSGDDKVQVEWVVKFEGKIFTIYDWKTYDREFTEHSLTKFNVGSKDVTALEVQEFIEFVKGQIEYAYDNFDLV